MLLTPAQTKPNRLNRDGTSSSSSSSFTRGASISCLRVCLDATLHPQCYQYPNLSKGADSVGRQVREDKECPFSGVANPGKSLEEGTGKRCSECGKLLDNSKVTNHPTTHTGSRYGAVVPTLSSEFQPCPKSSVNLRNALFY